VTVAVVIGAYELVSAASARFSRWGEARPGCAAAALAHALIPIALALRRALLHAVRLSVPGTSCG
jgi:hypothetical protein